MRLFLATAYYTYRGLFVWMTPSMYVAQLILLPLAQVAFFSLIGSYGGGQPLDFYLIGNAMVIAGTSGFFIGMSINEERALGTLTYLIASPANRLALFFGRTVSRILEAILHVVVAFAWVGLAFGLVIPIGHWPAILLAVLTAALSAAGLGLLLGVAAYLALDAGLLGNLMIFTLLLLSGANIPLDELPPALALLGQALPLTHSIEAARALAAGAGVPAVAPLLLRDLATGLVYGVCSFLLFGRVEAFARRRGTLEGV